MAQCFNALSLRAKFKDRNSVIITVMDSKTDTVYAIVWQFRASKMKKAEIEAQNVTEGVTEEDE